jgi:hypothetical protein
MKKIFVVIISLFLFFNHILISKNNKNFEIIKKYKKKIKTYHSIKYFPENIKNNKAIVMYTLKKFPKSLKYLSAKYKDNKQIVELAMKKKDRVLKYASNRLKNDKEFVLKSLKKYDQSLKYVSDRLKDNKKFILKAIKKKDRVLKYASNRLRDDKDVVKVACIYGRFDNFQYASDRLKDDKEFILKHYKYIQINYISKRLKNDIDIAKIFISKKDSAFQYLSKKLKNNKEIAWLAIKKNIYNIKYLGKKLKNNKKIALYVVKNAEWQSEKEKILFEYLDPVFRKDKDIAKWAYIKDRRNYKYIDKELKKNSARFFYWKNIDRFNLLLTEAIMHYSLNRLEYPSKNQRKFLLHSALSDFTIITLAGSNIRRTRFYFITGSIYDYINYKNILKEENYEIKNNFYKTSIFILILIKKYLFTQLKYGYIKNKSKSNELKFLTSYTVIISDTILNSLLYNIMLRLSEKKYESQTKEYQLDLMRIRF